MTDKIVFPSALTLAEDGLWEMPSWGRHPDDEQWINYGWKAWAPYAGPVFFQHKEKSAVQQWLTSHGYVDTGDDVHYQQSDPCDLCHKPTGKLAEQRTGMIHAWRVGIYIIITLGLIGSMPFLTGTVIPSILVGFQCLVVVASVAMTLSAKSKQAQKEPKL
jgi:hypothetical protein